MRPDGIIQSRDGTPTGPVSSVSFFIRGIRGLGSRFTSTKLSRGVIRPSCAVAFLAGCRTGGWRFRRGCSTGRAAQAGASRLPRASALPCLMRWRSFSRTQTRLSESADPAPPRASDLPPGADALVRAAAARKITNGVAALGSCATGGDLLAMVSIGRNLINSTR